MEHFGKNKFLEELKEFIENKKNKIKIVAVPVLVIAAVFFFWFNNYGICYDVCRNRKNE